MIEKVLEKKEYFQIMARLIEKSVVFVEDCEYIDPFKGCSNPNCTRLLDCDFCAKYWHDYFFVGPKLPEDF